jgi:hypothetical protein
MNQRNLDPAHGVVATIENQENPSQVVQIRYLREENAFATVGIREYFDQREILMPAHLVSANLQLIGTIVSAILERISIAHEKQVPFQYAQHFTVLERAYTLKQYGEFVKLEES